MTEFEHRALLYAVVAALTVGLLSTAYQVDRLRGDTVPVEAAAALSDVQYETVRRLTDRVDSLQRRVDFLERPNL